MSDQTDLRQYIGTNSAIRRYLLPDTALVEKDTGRLSVGGCDLLDLADRYGTPLFVYDEQHLRNRCQEALRAFGDGVAYGAKAFLCKEMVRLVEQEGLSLDVATGGELYVALMGGMAPGKAPTSVESGVRCLSGV